MGNRPTRELVESSHRGPAQPSLELASALATVARGEKPCYAFETYQRTIPSSQISFEHTVFLAVALARGDQEFAFLELPDAFTTDSSGWGRS
jgi:hypothetical protein